MIVRNKFDALLASAGSLPATWANFENLQSLNLDRNALTGESYPSLLMWCLCHAFGRQHQKDIFLKQAGLAGACQTCSPCRYLSMYEQDHHLLQCRRGHSCRMGTEWDARQPDKAVPVCKQADWLHSRTVSPLRHETQIHKWCLPAILHPPARLLKAMQALFLLCLLVLKA